MGGITNNGWIEICRTGGKWDLFEIEIQGKAEGNPLQIMKFRAFYRKEQTVTVDGFYDGDGIYRVRFMPSFEGEYRFKVTEAFQKKSMRAVLQ